MKEPRALRFCRPAALCIRWGMVICVLVCLRRRRRVRLAVEQAHRAGRVDCEIAGAVEPVDPAVRADGHVLAADDAGADVLEPDRRRLDQGGVARAVAQVAVEQGIQKARRDAHRALVADLDAVADDFIGLDHAAQADRIGGDLRGRRDLPVRFDVLGLDVAGDGQNAVHVDRGGGNAVFQTHHAVAFEIRRRHRAAALEVAVHAGGACAQVAVHRQAAVDVEAFRAHAAGDEHQPVDVRFPCGEVAFGLEAPVDLKRIRRDGGGAQGAVDREGLAGEGFRAAAEPVDGNLIVFAARKAAAAVDMNIRCHSFTPLSLQSGEQVPVLHFDAGGRLRNGDGAGGVDRVVKYERRVDL